MIENLKSLLKKFGNKNKKIQFAGISIHNSVVRVVLLTQEGDKYICDNVHEYVIEDPDNLPKLMNQIINGMELVDIPTSIVIPGSKTESVQIEITDLPTEDTLAALPWKLKDLVSISPQDMLCDYIEMKIQPLGQGAKAMVLATSKQYVKKLIAPFHERNVPILAITTEQFVLARMQDSVDTAQLVFVQHRESEAILLILKNQEICFARKIRGTEALINMTQQQMQEYGADTAAIEIQRSIDYYESQLKQPPIKDALVAMAGENDKLLVELLNGLLPIKTRLFPIEHIEDRSGSLSLNYLAGLGAALYGAKEGK